MKRITSSLLMFIAVLPALCQAPSTSDPINQVNENGLPEGLWIFLDEDQKPFLKAVYKNGRPADTLIFYKEKKPFLKLMELDDNKLLYILVDTNTKVFRTRENGKNKYRLPDGTFFKDIAPFVAYMEIKAFYPGGRAAFLKFQSENLRYPPSAVKKKIEGPVKASFLIRKDGSIDDIRIVEGLSRKCDKEVLRVLKLMPNWQPGLQRGYPITSRISTVINFKL